MRMPNLFVMATPVVLIMAAACSRVPDISDFHKRANAQELVSPGYRGMPFPVASWQARFIEAGDRIDIVMRPRKGDPLRKKLATATLIQNALVLEVRVPARKDEPDTVLLAVNPNEVQYLALALEDAKTQVLIRAKKDHEMPPTTQFIGFRKLFRN